MKKLAFYISLFFLFGCQTVKKGGKVQNMYPECVQGLINRFEMEEKTNPPQSIYRYQYKNKVVYFTPALCCDFFSNLYNDSCRLIGHPDGGITGRGDGRITDFFEIRSHEKLIWKDQRK